ncbi:LacI family transcriptional regulator [Agromyces badenianii]|uniref:LacI family transcriptional regulator n=1 Tax=Agromyces badenianii TaxID=2080742 RepID=A0A2S0WZ97_9MICO|nr:LacI family DNA-binding transcriptional regulator [Agromyces badenianii]AWB96631.1 LacI family transcriptional regulator [Agromyces badenianii]
MPRTADAAGSAKPRQRALSGGVGLAEVAAHAGVSEATVSRVINRKYGVSVSTREAVERSMRSLGFAREVRGELVLLLVPDLVNPIFAQLCNAIESELSPHGLRTVLCPVHPGTVQERDYVASLADTGIAGVVFLSSMNTLRNTDPGAREMLESRGIPYVSVNGGFSDAAAPAFSSDDWRAAELAVLHLFDLGHRRIGMCAGPVGNTPADRRVEGFVQVMDRLGLPDPEDFVVRHHYNVEGGRYAAEELIPAGVTAIVAGSDEMALGAVRAIQRRGLSVPGDISVIGYDDSPLLDFTNPPLTTVRQPVDRLAEHTARGIVALIGDRDVPTDEEYLEPELRLRASTGPVRSRGRA